MKDLKNNMFLKAGFIITIISLLMLPSKFVEKLIAERQIAQDVSIRDVSKKWGQEQTITGPYISIPYSLYPIDSIEQGWEDSELKWIYVLPENLNMNGNINPEKRFRGIYEVVVYESKFKVKGNFDELDIKSLDIPLNQIYFDKATLNIGISDLKGIERQIDVIWNNDTIPFDPGISSLDLATSGIKASIPIELDSVAYDFSFDIDLKGSQNINFIPVGKSTDVKMKSKWQTPSYRGTYLPDENKTTEKGFYSNWNVLHLNRNYPQMWKGSSFNVQPSSFGADLLLPVDNYRKSYRVVKFALAFLVLTFMVFFFVELLNKLFIHPIQYLLIGIAIVVFYVLQLSLSEHFDFDISYGISAGLTLLVISLYSISIFKSKKVSVIIFGILSILYGFVFTLIQLQDYALLIGSLGLFLILITVMILSRKIDWSNLSFANPFEKQKPKSPPGPNLPSKQPNLKDPIV